MKKKNQKAWYKFVSRKTSVEVVANIFINLTSGWFGVLLVVPGFLGASDTLEYLHLLTPNIVFGILGLLISLWLTEKSKTL